MRSNDKRAVDRVIRGTGSALDGRGLELYQRLVCCPGHIASVLQMLAAWDLEPLHRALSRLEVPLLLLAGERDRAVPLSQLREVAARLPGARLEVLPGLGHLLHEEDPEAIAQRVFAALGAQETRAAGAAR